MGTLDNRDRQGQPDEGAKKKKYCVKALGERRTPVSTRVRQGKKGVYNLWNTEVRKKTAGRLRRSLGGEESSKRQAKVGRKWQEYENPVCPGGKSKKGAGHRGGVGRNLK